MTKPKYLAGIGSPLQNEPVGFDPMIPLSLEPKTNNIYLRDVFNFNPLTGLPWGGTNLTVER